MWQTFRLAHFIFISLWLRFFFLISQWLLKTNAQKTPMRDMEMKAKVFFHVVWNWTEGFLKTVNINILSVSVCRGQSEPGSLHCDSDPGRAGGGRPLGHARAEGHGRPMVRWRLVTSPCSIISTWLHGHWVIHLHE